MDVQGLDALIAFGIQFTLPGHVTWLAGSEPRLGLTKAAMAGVRAHARVGASATFSASTNGLYVPADRTSCPSRRRSRQVRGRGWSPHMRRIERWNAMTS